MNALFHSAWELFQSIILPGLWRASWQASILALIVLALQKLLHTHIGGRGRYALWAIVVIRLMLPVLPSSRLSVFNLVRSTVTPAHATVASAEEPPKMVSISGNVGKESAVQTPAAVGSETSPQVRSVSQIVAVRGPGSISLPATLAVLWATGLIVLSCSILVLARRTRRLLSRLEPVTDPAILGIADRASRMINLQRCPRLLYGEAIPAPAVVGVAAPTIVLPHRVVSNCTPDEIELILLHELAHIRRRDVLANWVVTLVSVLHWFNPFIWFIAGRIRADRELACDEMVLSIASSEKQNAQAYGRTLLRLVELLSDGAARAPASQAVGILEPLNLIHRRMHMIAQFTPDRSSRRWVWLAVPLLVLGATALTDAVKGQARIQAAGPSSRPAAQTDIKAQPGPMTDADIQAALQIVLPELKLDAVGFSDVVDFLRDKSQTNIAVAWRALETAGIDRASPVTVRLRNVTIEQALQQILSDVGGANVRLGAEINAGALVISTREDLASNAKTVFYDISDLIVGRDGKPITEEEARKHKVDDLMNVIQESIAADSWKNNGGTVGAIKEFNGKLIIVQTPENQRQVEQLIARLRDKPSTQPRPLGQ